MNCTFSNLQINTLIANGDKTSLRKAVTENMYSVRITFSFCFSSYGCFEIEFSFPRFLYLLSCIRYTDSIFCQGNKFFVGFVTDAEFNLIPWSNLQALKNEIKLRESKWSKVYWEMIVPVVKVRTLRARLASTIIITTMFVLSMHLSSSSLLV